MASTLRTNRLARPAVIASSVVVALGLALVGCGSSGSDEPSTTEATSKPSTTATEATTTTTAATTTTSTPGEAQPELAVWPFASGEQRFTSPVDAARSFATDYLGMASPVVGEFQQGDSRSGEVPIKPAETGPTTTVLVRQAAGDASWWVIGAASDHLRLEQPDALATISSPVALSGQSTAFEATINVQVRRDGSVDPIGEGTAMGGANGEMGPFATDLAFDAAGASSGAIVLQTFSEEDGGVMEASVVRVAFTG
ncbi:MAG: Gmad2 immunoglobulin-like domain-containing protein [Acidimicrobiales bacterium]